MYKSEFLIPFPSEREAEVAFNSLRVEVEPSRYPQCFWSSLLKYS